MVARAQWQRRLGVERDQLPQQFVARCRTGAFLGPRPCGVEEGGVLLTLQVLARAAS